METHSPFMHWLHTTPYRKTLLRLTLPKPHSGGWSSQATTRCIRDTFSTLREMASPSNEMQWCHRPPTLATKTRIVQYIYWKRLLSCTRYGPTPCYARG